MTGLAWAVLAFGALALTASIASGPLSDATRESIKRDMTGGRVLATLLRAAYVLTSMVMTLVVIV